MRRTHSLLILALLSTPTAWELDRRIRLWPELADWPTLLRLGVCGLVAFVLTHLLWESLVSQVRQSRRVVAHLQDPTQPSEEVASPW